MTVGDCQTAGITLAVSEGISTSYDYIHVNSTAYDGLSGQFAPLYPLTQFAISSPEQEARSSFLHTAQLPRHRFMDTICTWARIGTIIVSRRKREFTRIALSTKF